MDVPLTGSMKDIEGISHNMQLLSKPLVKKPVEEVKQNFLLQICIVDAVYDPNFLSGRYLLHRLQGQSCIAKL
jgi:hypothetical protein